MPGSAGKLNAWAEGCETAVRITRKGKVLYSRKKAGETAALPPPSHNRKKNYLLSEGQVIEPLVDMGIFSKEGKILKPMYDKYKQINRFLEIIDDAVKKQKLTHLNIIDFGCGKSYLTFIVYYYLTQVRGLSVHMIGLDLKADVIEACSRAAEKYGYEGLSFQVGDIGGFQCPFEVDMVITLHACDTATDYALFNAVAWGSKMIFSVPCCQHEWNRQMKNKVMEPVLQYGLLKERMAALLTDGVRAEVLEQMGYRTQILEFIDMEHTPKNILIRAVYQGQNPKQNKRNAEKLKELLQFWTVNPTLVKLLLPKLSEAAEPLNF